MPIYQYIDICILCHLFSVVSMGLLIINGDVELNPGPHQVTNSRYFTCFSLKYVSSILSVTQVELLTAVCCLNCTNVALLDAC